LATPNYGYEKRQRELAKKNKKAEKLRDKEARKLNPESATDEVVAPESAEPPAPAVPE
jgi:hypothetical protein